MLTSVMIRTAKPRGIPGAFVLPTLLLSQKCTSRGRDFEKTCLTYIYMLQWCQARETGQIHISQKCEKEDSMANWCQAILDVRGKKNACYSFVWGVVWMDEPWISERGTDDDCRLIVSGDVPWDPFSRNDSKWNGEVPVPIPDDLNAAIGKAIDQYQGYDYESSTAMFQVDVRFNYCDPEFVEGSYPDGYGENYFHYSNGKRLSTRDEKCPKELLIHI